MVVGLTLWRARSSSIHLYHLVLMVPSLLVHPLPIRFLWSIYSHASTRAFPVIIKVLSRLWHVSPCANCVFFPHAYVSETLQTFFYTVLTQDSWTLFKTLFLALIDAIPRRRSGIAKGEMFEVPQGVPEIHVSEHPQSLKWRFFSSFTEPCCSVAVLWILSDNMGLGLWSAMFI
jgi:hypothetical protein